MDPHDYIRLLRKSWLILTITAAAGSLAGGVLGSFQVPQYSSTARLYVSVPAQSASAGSDLNQGSTFARQAVISFVDVVDSQIVLQRAGRKMMPSMSASEIGEHVSAASPAGTVLIEVQGRDPNPARAAEIANAVAEAFTDTVTNELEKPSSGGDSLIRISTVQHATAALAPSSPRISLMALVGLFVGIACGFTIAMLRAILDTRIRTPRDLETLSEKPLVGALYFDDDASRHPLVVHTAPRDARSEAFRRLRTSLQFLNVGGLHRAFVVSSSGPGESKTYTACNLAVALAETGAKVVIVDADLRRPMVARTFGIESAAGLTDALIGRAELTDVLQRWGHNNLAVLPSGPLPPNPSEMLGSNAMAAMVGELEAMFDYVVLDGPPLLPVTDAAVLSRFVGVLFVSAIGKSRKNDVSAALTTLDQVGATVLGVIATFLPVQGPDSTSYAAYSYYGNESSPRQLPSVRERLGRRKGIGGAIRGRTR